MKKITNIVPFRKKDPHERDSDPRDEKHHHRNLKDTGSVFTASHDALRATHDKLDEGTYIIFDIETTGGNPEKNGITEICAIKIRKGEVEDRFYAMVNPQVPIPPIVRRMTGINNKMVRNKPPIEEIMPGFLTFIKNHILVSHNTIGDLKFIRYFATKSTGHTVENFFICTHLLAEKLISDAPNKSLKGLATFLDFKSADFHRAVADAEVTLHLFKEILTRLKKQNCRTIDEAIRFQSDYESGIRLGWKVEKREIESLPDKPGILHLYDRNHELLFFSSTLSLKREAKKLLKFTQLPRPMLKIILHSVHLKAQECKTNFEALKTEIELERKNTTKFPARLWHQRVVQTLYFVKNKRQILAKLGGIEANTFAAFGPINDRKMMQEFLQAILKLFNLEHQHGGYVIPTPLFKCLVLHVEGKGDEEVKKLKSLLKNPLLNILFPLKKQYEQKEKILSAIKALKFPFQLKSVFDHHGIIVLPEAKVGHWTIYYVANSLFFDSKKIEVDWQDYLRNKNASIVSKIKSHINKNSDILDTGLNAIQSSEMNLFLWWLQSGVNKKDGIYLSLDELRNFQ